MSALMYFKVMCTIKVRGKKKFYNFRVQGYVFCNTHWYLYYASMLPSDNLMNFQPATLFLLQKNKKRGHPHLVPCSLLGPTRVMGTHE